MNTKENVVTRLSRGLRHESLAYRIYGIVALVLSIIIIVCGLVMTIGGAFLTDAEYQNEANIINNEFIDGDTDVILGNSSIDITDDDVHIHIDGDDINITEDDVAIFAGASVVFMGVFYSIYGFVYLAVAIVNLVLASKIKKYSLNADLTVKHAGSVGSIVVAALFNQIALIFVIINFVIAKKNRAVLEG